MKKCIFIALMLLAGQVAAEIYKWTDESGRVHYSDKASKDRPVEKVEIRVNSYEHVSYGAFPSSIGTADNQVKMYSASWCGYCKKARNYFIAKKIPFKELDIEKDRRARREYDAMGGKGVPIILVGKKRMNGFSISGFNRIYQ